jgi:hypothetical protein
MRDGAYITDGTKAIPLSALRPEAWTPADDEEVGGSSGLTVRRGQTRVPVLYRAIDIRAKAVSRMPFFLERGGVDVTNDAALLPLIQQLRRLLYLTEASLCCYNAAYWELGTNVAGRNLTPFWLATPSVRPDIDPLTGLRGFWRTGGRGSYLQPRQVCSYWGLSTDIEIGPDPSLAPVAVTLGAAGLLHYLDRFAIGFFQRGATKVTLLSVEGNPPQKELDKLDAWWKRMVSGVRNAFGSVVIRAGVKPQVIGSSIQETAAPALVKLSREDVAIGMGVPMSLLFSNALAGGTADAERLNFYDFTVVPECESVIDEPLNGLYLDRLGLRLIWAPEKLEVYQKAELAKAQSLAQLVGAPMMTVDEGRERLELPPMPQSAPPAESKPGLEPGQPDATPGAEPPPPSLDAPTTTTTTADSILLPGTFDELKAFDLELWQRKALKRLKAGRAPACSFRSEHLDEAELWLIGHALEHATTPEAVKAAFIPPPPGEDLTDEERPLYEQLKAVFDRAGQQATRAIIAGESLDALVRETMAGVRAALLASLAGTVDLHLDGLAGAIGVAFDTPALAQDLAGQYVTTYLAKMEQTTRAALERAVAAYRATPGMSREAITALLRGAFGARRAELIAITATCEAASLAVDRYEVLLVEQGITMEAVWNTVGDERTCAICGPLNGKPRSEWGGRDMPAHFRCRCFKTLRVKK